jgi:hypothetical protein
MHDYCLYVYDEEGSLIGAPLTIPAEDDDMAVRAALERLGGNLRAELRDGERLVQKFSPGERRPPGPRRLCLLILSGY